MITTIATFSLKEARTLAEAKEIFLSTAPKYQNVEGLLRKSYIVSQDGMSVGGIYQWQSRANAEAMYTEEWYAFVTEKYGTEPTVNYFETPVVVDNIAGEIQAI